MKIPLLKRNDFIYIAFLVLLVFTLSSSILFDRDHPRTNPTGYKPFCRLSDDSPFMWQYNADSFSRLEAAAYFPEAYNYITPSVNRPVFPALAHGIGHVVSVVVSPVYALDYPYVRGVIGYLILKIGVYFLGGLALLKILKIYMSDRASYLAAFCVFIHFFCLNMAARYHAGEMQLWNPVFIIFCLLYVRQHYSLRNLMLFSFFTGLLMLAKNNYAIVITVFIYALWLKKFKEAAIYAACHITPLVVWRLTLTQIDIKWVDGSLSAGHGVPYLEELIAMPLLSSMKQVAMGVEVYLLMLWRYYMLWIFVFVCAIVVLVKNKKYQQYVPLFFMIFLFWNWAQLFATRFMTWRHLTSDLSLYVFGLSSWLLVDYLFKTKHLRLLVMCVVAVTWAWWNIDCYYYQKWIVVNEGREENSFDITKRMWIRDSED